MQMTLTAPIAMLAFLSTAVRGQLSMIAVGSALQTGDFCETLIGSDGKITSLGNTGGVGYTEASYTPAIDAGFAGTVIVNTTKPASCAGEYTCVKTGDRSSTCTMTKNSCCGGSDTEACLPAEFAASLDLRCAQAYQVTDVATLKPTSSKILSGDGCYTLKGYGGRFYGPTGTNVRGTFSPVLFYPGQADTTLEVTTEAPSACIGTYNCKKSGYASAICTMGKNSCCAGETCTDSEFDASSDLRCAAEYTISSTRTDPNVGAAASMKVSALVAMLALIMAFFH